MSTVCFPPMQRCDSHNALITTVTTPIPYWEPCPERHKFRRKPKNSPLAIFEVYDVKKRSVS